MVSKRIFPEYAYERSRTVWKDRHELDEYAQALKIQFEVEQLLDSRVGEEGVVVQECIWKRGTDMLNKVLSRWEEIVETERERIRHGEGEHAENKPYFLKTFEAGEPLFV